MAWFGIKWPEKLKQNKQPPNQSKRRYVNSRRWPTCINVLIKVQMSVCLILSSPRSSDNVFISTVYIFDKLALQTITIRVSSINIHDVLGISLSVI